MITLQLQANDHSTIRGYRALPKLGKRHCLTVCRIVETSFQVRRLSLHLTLAGVRQSQRSPLWHSGFCSDQLSFGLQRIWRVHCENCCKRMKHQTREQRHMHRRGLVALSGQSLRAAVKARMYTYTCRGTLSTHQGYLASESAAIPVC